jgi:hypothetical protein
MSHAISVVSNTDLSRVGACSLNGESSTTQAKTVEPPNTDGDWVTVE